jgi:hypothetical protein
MNVRACKLPIDGPSCWFIALVHLAVCVLATPTHANASELSPRERDTLRRYARDTWRSFQDMALENGLAVDGLVYRGNGLWERSRRTSPTDIAAYLWSVLAAEKLGLLGAEEVYRRLDRTLTTLAGMPRAHGFFFNRIEPHTGALLKNDPYDGNPLRVFLSSVDNGWLAASLLMVGNTQPRLRKQTSALLELMNFHCFYEPYDPVDPMSHPGMLHAGYRISDVGVGFDNCYAMLNTEPRMASYIGIALGQLPREHYYRMYRTWPPGRVVIPQRQVPQGVTRRYEGVSVFEGHYTYRGLNIVPSWGGSMFEALMVPLFVPEAEWAKHSWGVNHPLYVRAQIEHGLNEAHYGYWGFSPACKPEGGYKTYGVDAIGTDPEVYTSSNKDTKSRAGQKRSAQSFKNGVVTPHASFLALRFAPHEATANLQALTAAFPIYSDRGFFDSVNISTKVVSKVVLALDQGMIMAAIANALADDAMQHAFSDGLIESRIRTLIAPEEFTAGTDRSSTDRMPAPPS